MDIAWKIFREPDIGGREPLLPLLTFTPHHHPREIQVPPSVASGGLPDYSQKVRFSVFGTQQELRRDSLLDFNQESVRISVGPAYVHTVLPTVRFYAHFFMGNWRNYLVLCSLVRHSRFVAHVR